MRDIYNILVTGEIGFKSLSRKYVLKNFPPLKGHLQIFQEKRNEITEKVK